MAPDTNPSSWRDVYALVRDSRSDVLEAVEEVGGRVDILTIRFNNHEVTHAREYGADSMRTSIFGIARSTIALAVSVVSAAVAVVAVVSK